MNRISATAGKFVWIKKDWSYFALVLFLSVFAFAAGLGSFGILDPSDGYYSEGAREMFESGDYLTPHLNYEPFFDKPILNYWLISLCYKLFGVSELAARIPAACSGAFICLFLYIFARQFISSRGALVASLALVAMPMWLSLGHMSLTDMPLSCFVWVSIFAFFLAIEKKLRRFSYLGYLALGCGLLTKGPLAGFLVVANLALYLLVMKRPLRQFLDLITYLYVIPGLLVTLLIAAPWYYCENVVTNGVFFQEFFLNQNINRAMGAVDHKAGPLYYFPLFIGGSFPWSFFLLALIPVGFREPFRFVKRLWLDKSQRSQSSEVFASDHLKITIFGAVSTLFMLLFFTALPTKLATYILPVFPALALLTGILFEKMMRLKKLPFSRLPAAAVGVVGAASALALAYTSIKTSINFGHSKGAAAVASFLANTEPGLRVTLMFAMLVLTAGSIILVVSANSNLKKGLRMQVMAAVAAIVVAVPVGIILAWQDKCRDFQALVTDSGNLNVYATMQGRRSPSAEFYLQRKVRFILAEEEIADDAKAQPPGTYYLLNDYITSSLSDAHVPFEVVSQRGIWRLLKTR